MPDRATKVGVRIQCAVCGQQKQPRGRSSAIGTHLCDHECSGYQLEPRVGSLWPGETDAAFGFPCGDDGTRPVTCPGCDHPYSECDCWPGGRI